MDKLEASAKRLQLNQDFHDILEHWLKEQTVVLVNSVNHNLKAEARKYHAVREFGEFVEQLAEEADANG